MRFAAWAQFERLPGSGAAHSANDGGVKPPSVVELTATEQSYIRKCVDVIVALLRVYGFDSSGYGMKGNYDHWIHMAAVHGSPMGYVKWKIASYYAGHKSVPGDLQELPPSECLRYENVRCLLGGKAYKWLQVMKSAEPKRFESFLTSVLYSKKGMPRPGKEAIKENVAKSFKTLTTPPVWNHPVRPRTLISWADAEDLPRDVECVLSQETMSKQIKRTVTEVLKGASMTEDDWIKPFFPSTKANYDYGRHDAGTLGMLVSEIHRGTGDSDDPHLLDGLRCAAGERLVHMSVDEPSIRTVERVTPVEPGASGPLFTDRVRSGYTRTMVDRSELKRRWMVLYDRLVSKARTEIPYTELVGLPEALKVRVISKGPPKHYFVLRPLQQKLWSSLKRMSVFRLIGEKVTETVVQEQLGNQLGGGEKFLSVDYSDATNQMYSWCSDAAIEQICEELKITGDLKQVFYESMTQHVIMDPTNSRGSDLKFRPQANGQLMGSIVSFPILCIVNAAICRWMLELSNLRKIPLRDAKLAINGDDAVMKCTSEGKRLWEVIGTFCGLKPSVGKVYFSSSFLNLNSTTYNYSQEGFGQLDEKRVKHYQLVRYVNLGLLFGLRRSGGQLSLVNDVGEWGSLGAQAQQLVADSPDDIRENVLCQFIHHNEAALKAFNLPWFLPEHLCGVGLPSVGKYQPEKFDLQVARKILENPDKFRVNRVRPSVPYKVWEYVNKRVKFTNAMKNIGSGYEGTLSESDITGMMCIEAIFTARLDELVDLEAITTDKVIKAERQKSENTRMTTALRRVANVWKRARHDQSIPLGSPLEPIPGPSVSMADVPFAFETTRSRLLTE